ncbi:MAG: terpene cyclase/mutase family protein [Thermoguttaceae bacterium]|nr:terpene cyclase/mutase family protein [Thermoguttaceae bacterium]MDW8077790.1 terpene cyclase/mutase family protein [Thermoguttaceae bacterium]
MPCWRASSAETGWTFPRGIESWCALICLCFVVVGWSGCGGSSPPPQAQVSQPKTPPPPPPPKPIQLASFAPVSLDPGQKTKVAVKVDRAGNQGPIDLAISDAPDGVKVTVSQIPDGESDGTLEIAVDEKLGDQELKARLKVTAKLGELSAEQPLELTVRKINLPTFSPVQDVVLFPATPVDLRISVERSGFAGPIPLTIEGVPPKLTAKVDNLAAGAKEVVVRLEPDADIPEGQHTLRLVGRVLGRSIEQQINVRVDRAPVRLNTFRVITLRPGEGQLVRAPVERKGYAGPVRVTVENAPEGVTVPDVEVPPDGKEVALDIQVAPTAREQVVTLRVVSQVGQFRRWDPLILRISYGESGFLPREIMADPNLAPLLRRGSFGGRLTAESKEALMRAYGGTPESHEAVLRGLRWFARHQAKDGRWSLKYYHESQLTCTCWSEFEKDVVNEDIAGTAFALLAFLGEGITHNRAPERPSELAEYRRVVQRGLEFLVRSQVGDPKSKEAGKLSGNMYAHALGTMALCEAYGLSQDERLRVPTQLAIRYLMDAQHSEGGWRYGPKQPGDLSVTSWVFFAIRSGQLAGLMIPKDPLLRAQRFVDSCACGPPELIRTRYCYDPRAAEKEPKLSMTAAGLLTRQYLGCRKDDRELVAGCQYLAQNLPPEGGTALGQIYYYHYATQVLHHMEGPEFDLWNYRMREHLIRTQEKEGCKAGSWNPEGTDWGSHGGRIYATGLAIMTLQVYYRHLPLYRPIVRTATGGATLGGEVKEGVD